MELFLPLRRQRKGRDHLLDESLETGAMSPQGKCENFQPTQSKDFPNVPNLAGVGGNLRKLRIHSLFSLNAVYKPPCYYHY